MNYGKNGAIVVLVGLIGGMLFLTACEKHKIPAPSGTPTARQEPGTSPVSSGAQDAETPERKATRLEMKNQDLQVEIEILKTVNAQLKQEVHSLRAELDKKNGDK